jgi:hypothetical protein
MLEKKRSLGVLHARMREVEDELFRAEYSGEINPDPSDARDISDYHVGTSAMDVKIWVEQMAIGLGYDRVVWDELPMGVLGVTAQPPLGTGKPSRIAWMA